MITGSAFDTTVAARIDTKMPIIRPERAWRTSRRLIAAVGAPAPPTPVSVVAVMVLLSSGAVRAVRSAGRAGSRQAGGDGVQRLVDQGGQRGGALLDVPAAQAHPHGGGEDRGEQAGQQIGVEV